MRDSAWKGLERSDGSRQKLLSPLVKEGSGIGKWTSMSTQQKFCPDELIAETIATSEKVPALSNECVAVVHILNVVRCSAHLLVVDAEEICC